MDKIAILYDFDKTLCDKNMQEYSLLPSLNVDANSFWQEVGTISKENNMDAILAYMYLLVKHSKDHPITRKNLNDLGKDVTFYPGVVDYFKRINEYGLSKNIEIQHFIISSGTLEIIEGTSIYPYFTKVYACSYHYNENGYADWPALAINYTSKTQFLFRISKGSLDVYDDSKINVKSKQFAIPFNHMIYIADGYTDIPCMQIIKGYGGFAIAVYNENDKKTCNQLLKDGRVNFTAKADYSQNGEIDACIKNIINIIAKG